jgi:hypothetical protein
MSSRRTKTLLSSRTRRLTAVAAACAALLTAAATAVGDTTTRTDPKDDVRGVPVGGGFDFKSATATHGRDGRVMVHNIASYYPDPLGFGAVQLDIDSDSEGGYDFYVKKVRREAALFNYRTHKRVAPAGFRRISAWKISLSFKDEAIGAPPRYRWRVRIVAERGRVIDALPNRGSITHKMPVLDD